MKSIFIIDNHLLFRTALLQLFYKHQKYSVVGHSDSLVSSIAEIKAVNPDIILVDAHLEDASIFEAINRLKGYANKIIAMVSNALHPILFQIINSDIYSCISKKVSNPDLLKAIEVTLLGKRFLSQDILSFVAYQQMNREKGSCFDLLSSREMQVVLMLLHCKKIKEISEILYLSPKTVNSYRYRVFEKLSISSDMELLILALQYELLSYDELVIPNYD